MLNNQGYTAICDTLSMVIPIILALSGAVPILIWGYIKADIPALQVRITFRELGAKKTAKNNKVENAFTKYIDKQAAARSDREVVLSEQVNIWCLRLGMTDTYEDFKRKASKQASLFYVIGILFGLFGLATGQTILLALTAFSFILGAFLLWFMIEGIKSKIRKLNRSILFELPILISNFAEILPTGKKSVEDIFRDYKPQAKAIRQDLDLVLADFMNYTRQRALSDMSARMQTGIAFDEIAQFLDQIKTSGDLNIISMNLHKQADRIYEVSVQPYLLSVRGKRQGLLTMCAFVALILVFCLFTAPNIIDFLMNLSSLSM